MKPSAWWWNIYQSGLTALSSNYSFCIIHFAVHDGISSLGLICMILPDHFFPGFVWHQPLAQMSPTKENPGYAMSLYSPVLIMQAQKSNQLQWNLILNCIHTLQTYGLWNSFSMALNPMRRTIIWMIMCSICMIAGVVLEPAHLLAQFGSLQDALQLFILFPTASKHKAAEWRAVRNTALLCAVLKKQTQKIESTSQHGTFCTWTKRLV